MRRLSVLLLFPLLFACSSDTGTGSSAPTCSATLAGGMAATEACTGAASTTFVGNEDNTGIQLNYNPPAGSNENTGFNAFMVFDGVLVAGHTYHSSDDGANGTLETTLHGADWQAFGGGNDPTLGSYSMTVSSITALATIGSSTTYTMHGTLTATLVPQTGTGAVGTVTVQATF